MKTIARSFDSIKQADKYQFWLYGKYDSVKLVQSPMFTEQGIYVWIVG